jgi:hypothetical protein
VKVDNDKENTTQKQNGTISTVEPTKKNKFIIKLKNYIKDFSVLKKIKISGYNFTFFMPLCN